MPKPAKTICNCAVYRRNQSTSTLCTSESIETLVRVADEWEAGGVLVLSRLGGLCPVGSAVVILVDLINGEVLCVDIGLQLRLEWCADASQAIPRDATEEGMLLDLARSANTTESMISVADQSKMMRQYTSQL